MAHINKNLGNSKLGMYHYREAVVINDIVNFGLENIRSNRKRFCEQLGSRVYDGRVEVPNKEDDRLAATVKFIIFNY